MRRNKLLTANAADLIWAPTNSAIVERLLEDRRRPPKQFEARFAEVLMRTLIS